MAALDRLAVLAEKAAMVFQTWVLLRASATAVAAQPLPVVLP